MCFKENLDKKAIIFKDQVSDIAVQKKPTHAQQILKHPSTEGPGVLAWDLNNLLPRNVSFRHDFKLTGGTPVWYSIIKISERHIDILKQEIEVLLATLIIKPATLASIATAVIAKKKAAILRFYVPYQALSERMKADKFRLLMIEEATDEIVS